MKRRHALILSLLAVCLIASTVSLFSLHAPATESVVISRVIDGDTVNLADGRTLRLANINAPEKSSPLSMAATEFLRHYENKSVDIEVLDEDNYNRFVARIYAPDYINENLVSLGLASKAWVYDDELSNFAKLENQAISEGKGIWQHSPYWHCLTADIEAKAEIVYLHNNCNVSISGFYLKDESRKTYKFLNSTQGDIELHTCNGTDSGSLLYWNSGDVWNNDRDSIYVFDSENRLVFYHSYGY